MRSCHLRCNLNTVNLQTVQFIYTHNIEGDFNYQRPDVWYEICMNSCFFLYISAAVWWQTVPVILVTMFYYFVWRFSPTKLGTHKHTRATTYTQSYQENPGVKSTERRLKNKKKTHIWGRSFVQVFLNQEVRTFGVFLHVWADRTARDGTNFLLHSEFMCFLMLNFIQWKQKPFFN